MAANHTYQIRADLISRQDPLRLYRGYVTIEVQSTSSIEVSVGYVSPSSLDAPYHNRRPRCALPVLCPPIDAYRLINSDTQAAFTSLTSHNLSSNSSIRWQVYTGRMSSSMQWTLLDNTTQYIGRWFFGKPILSSMPVKLIRLSCRTDCAKLHLHSRSAAHLSHRRVLACGIDLVGRVSERIEFTRPEDELPSGEWHLFCLPSEWNHQHRVHGQLLELDRLRWHQRLLALQSVLEAPPKSATTISIHPLGWTTDRSTRSLVGFSPSPSMDVQLPAGGDSNSTMLHLSVRVRDEYGCSFEFEMPTVLIARDTTTLVMLINALQSVSSQSNALAQALADGNQNEVNQLLASLSQMLNTMNNDALQTALIVGENIPATTLFVSSLDLFFSPPPTNASSSTVNTTSALAEYERQRNQVASVLDYLMTFVSNLPIDGIGSITLQSSTLAELTKPTSALTRDATVRIPLTLT